MKEKDKKAQWIKNIEEMAKHPEKVNIALSIEEKKKPEPVNKKAS